VGGRHPDVHGGTPVGGGQFIGACRRQIVDPAFDQAICRTTIDLVGEISLLTEHTRPLWRVTLRQAARFSKYDMRLSRVRGAHIDGMSSQFDMHQAVITGSKYSTNAAVAGIVPSCRSTSVPKLLARTCPGCGALGWGDTRRQARTNRPNERGRPAGRPLVLIRYA